MASFLSALGSNLFSFRELMVSYVLQSITPFLSMCALIAWFIFIGWFLFAGIASKVSSPKKETSQLWLQNSPTERIIKKLIQAEGDENE